MQKPKSGVATILFDFFEITIIASVVVLAVALLIGQLLEVSGTSMVPNLNDHEQLLSERISYKYTDPKRGDIVVFKHPGQENLLIVKRIIGMPGETLTIKNGKVYINGTKLNEPYLKANTTTIGREQIKDSIDFVIPQGSYIVLGDNRSDSIDSRNWGTLPKGLITGKALFVFSPISKMRFITN